MESKATAAEIQWRKSSYSGDQGGNCLEVADLPRHPTVAVRDSKNPAGPIVPLAPAAFAAFVDWAATAAH
ncbi:DUF397 domain-containing protein [Streptomyces mutabilis]|uniref:Toxin n=1 Tax=Streptomyces mutabilis TaxID=67332 RepID=A0A086N3Q7_9ACTN|nr:DUF397 domain-containing protein [Streptomyces mutabilis]KFG75775.1 toxin [Streptomyces mutabilis]